MGQLYFTVPWWVHQSVHKWRQWLTLSQNQLVWQEVTASQGSSLIHGWLLNRPRLNWPIAGGSCCFDIMNYWLFHVFRIVFCGFSPHFLAVIFCLHFLLSCFLNLGGISCWGFSIWLSLILSFWSSNVFLHSWSFHVKRSISYWDCFCQWV